MNRALPIYSASFWARSSRETRRERRRSGRNGSTGSRIEGWRREWEAAVAPGYTDDATPINPPRAAHEINGALPDDAILVSDIGVHHNWLLQFCKPRGPTSLIGCMGFGPMGFGYLGGRELAIDFRHPETGEPYNPDFAALARSCGIEGVRIDRAGDLGDAIKAAIATGRPYLIDANIGADLNPGGAGVWELPRHGVGKPFIGGRYEPG